MRPVFASARNAEASSIHCAVCAPVAVIRPPRTTLIRGALDVTDPVSAVPATLLAIECSSATASVALRHRGALTSREGETASATVDQVLQWCAQLMRDADVDHDQLGAIAVGIGPGAFTGVRVAISVAQGLALAWGKRIIPVSSLAALATAAFDEAQPMPVLALMDARMDEVYAGWYDASPSGLMIALADEQVMPPERLQRVPAAAQGYRIIGNGYPLHAVRIASALPSPARVIEAVPSAAQVAMLAMRIGLSAGIEPGEIEPAYLRNKVALTTAERTAARTA